MLVKKAVRQHESDAILGVVHLPRTGAQPSVLPADSQRFLGRRS